MAYKKTLTRLVAISACVVWGLVELMALQKSRLSTRQH
jgi:hypothetical protein